MTMLTRRLLLGAAAAPAIARAQAYPARQIRWICAQSAGGTMDLTTRTVQSFLQLQGLRSQIAYVSGGGGNVARTELYNAAPDGYTIMTDTIPSPALGEVVAKAAFDATALEPIYGWSIEGWQICTQKGSPIKTLRDLVALSQQRPIVAGTVGRGGASHLQLILLRQATGMKLNIVHFSGSAQAYPQVIGGNIDIACTGPGSASRSADNLQFVCVFRDREPALPGVTSAKAQGYDVASVDQVWYAMTAPKVPQDRLDKLEGLFAAMCKAPEFAEAQTKAGIQTVDPVSRAELHRMIVEGHETALKYQAELSGA